MSVNRENVIWQSPDGTWSRAFYDFYPVGQDDEDWDFEWGVEYTDEFNWLRTGLASEEEAVDAWNGANPGGWTTYSGPEYAERIAELDAKAQAYRAAARS